MVDYKIENLSFAYPDSEKNVLDSINVEIKEGEFVLVCGKSGSGKTTFLRHLKPVLAPYGKKSGSIEFRGTPIDDIDKVTQASNIGYVLQNPDEQIVTDKVWHELAFGLENLGVKREVMQLRIGEMSSYFGITGWFDKDVMQLSGGQKQILNLASIMAMQPKVLVLDEPTSQLDPIAAADFLNTIKKLNRELGLTIIISEHRLEDIYPYCDRVLVLDEGRLICDDEPRRVAEKLIDMGHDMMCALPSPIAIYCGDEGNVPMTVRQGRDWLEDYLNAHGLSQNQQISNAGSMDSESKKKCNEEECRSAIQVKGNYVKDNNIQDNQAYAISLNDNNVQDNQAYAISLKDVYFRYEKQAPDILKNLTLNIPSQCIYAIVGSNGTGKSTLLKVIGNIKKAYSGNIKIFGKSIKKDKQMYQSDLVILPQDPTSLFTSKTVLGEFKEIKKDENDSQMKEIIELLELEDVLDRHPYDLSGGQQQRLALGKLLLLEPKILLLDEPTKSIDAFFKRKLGAVLNTLKQKGVTIVLVSHDIEFCAEYADRVALMFNGEIVAENDKKAFFINNTFYTTTANRMCRELLKDVVTVSDAKNQLSMVTSNINGR